MTAAPPLKTTPAATEPEPKTAVSKKTPATAAKAEPPPSAPVASPDAAAPSKAGKLFALELPEAQAVFLSGEFNGWSPQTIPMKRAGNGPWEAVVPLPPGRYEYKFVADGQWITDPRALEQAVNQHGSFNSVVVVPA